jgi:hypothetical protein
MRGGVDETADAANQRSVVSGEGSFEVRGPSRFQLCQGAGVGEDVARRGYGQIVAAMLSFGADLAGEPPHRGMVEEQALGDALQQVDQVIVTADVRQLMRQQRLHVIRREAGKQAQRRQDDRTEPSDHRERFHVIRYQQPYRPADAHPYDKALERVLPFG